MSTSAATSRHPRPSGNLQRVTVNLTPRSREALETAVKLTGDSQTDIINRAIQVYAYITDITENSGTLYVRDKGNDQLERLRFV